MANWLAPLRPSDAVDSASAGSAGPSDELIAELKGNDVIVIAAPMYNQISRRS
ncbi:hypothetical protein MJ579_13345 [Klebsiella pneumoniae]|nr:hypothetical protein MJ579_13345 [Klebsiella pneumoniae]